MNTNTTWQKVLGGIALSTALAGGSVAVQAEDGVLNEYDANNSGTVEFTEFKGGFDVDKMYSNWDTDGDGKVNQKEYSKGLYNSYDQDNSNDLNENEFKTFKDDAGEGGWMDV